MANTSNNRSGASTLAAGLAGAAVGAAAAVILSDKEKRDRLAGAVKDLRQKGEDLQNSIGQKMGEVRGKLESEVSEQTGKAKNEAKRLDDSSKKA